MSKTVRDLEYFTNGANNLQDTVFILLFSRYKTVNIEFFERPNANWLKCKAFSQLLPSFNDLILFIIKISRMAFTP